MSNIPKPTEPDKPPIADSTTLAIAVGKTQQAVESMSRNVDSMSSQVTHVLGAIQTLNAKVETLEPRIDRIDGEVQELRMGATRPRQNTLNEIEGAPGISTSIHSIAQESKQTYRLNRLQTIGLVLGAAIWILDKLAHLFH